MNWGFGTPSYMEHMGHWKRSPTEPDVTPEEYDRVYLQLSEWLEKRFDEINSERALPVCYFIGDFCGDRTQQLQMYDFSLLTSELVRAMQDLLRGGDFSSWRIAVGADAPEDVLLIYPNAVCISRLLDENEIDSEIAHLSCRHVEGDRRAEEERMARIDRVRPFLEEAYERAALNPASLHLVYTEFGEGKDDGLVRMWVIHPMDVWSFDVDEYGTTPDAGHAERFYLLKGGVLVDQGRNKPRNAVLLALWEFEGDNERSFRLERGDRFAQFSY